MIPCTYKAVDSCLNVRHEDEVKAIELKCVV
jgi:hypothetical protein